MPKEKREISKEDIMPLDVYTKNRKELRKNIVDFKKDRRVALGPYATFYFESYETMLAQVQEMLYIEKGGEEQLKDERTQCDSGPTSRQKHSAPASWAAIISKYEYKECGLSLNIKASI